MSVPTTGRRGTGPLQHPTSMPMTSLRGAWRRPVAPLVVVLVVAVLTGALGVTLGRATAPGNPAAAADLVERDVAPLSVDADGVWVAGVGDLPAVGEQLAGLRRTGDPGQITAHAEGWADAYDVLVRRMVGVEVPSSARPVQRQFVQSVTLTRDALDVLVEAAETDDPALRRELSSEALRLRTRSEQLTQTARASLGDLRGGTTGVAEPSGLPSLSELR